MGAEVIPYRLLQFWGFVHLIHLLPAQPNTDVVFVILSQANSYHDQLAESKKQDIILQFEKFDYAPRIYLTHRDFCDILGSWTIFPLFERLSALSNDSWIFFLEEVTNIDVKKLLFVLSAYDTSEDYFLGYGLKDSQSTIIHHFDLPGSPVISYPDFSAGFAISSTLVKKLALKRKQEQKLEFSIDARYELAKFIVKTTAINVFHEPHFCLLNHVANCATWIDRGFSKCSVPISKERIYFAVKTCKRFHNDRVQVVLNTWAKEASSIYFFSDTENSSIPTISLGIPNVLQGHCTKTLSILKYVSKNQFNADWLVIADDDTLISVERLRGLLACYDPSEHLVLGERYGYGVTVQHGYDYITGGGGMVFSKPTIEILLSTCECPSDDSPDDMILGLCLKKLGIPITHSPSFHQARPEDYSVKLLRHQRPISFHKHWMVDPYDVYETWLREPGSSKLHSEL